MMSLTIKPGRLFVLALPFLLAACGPQFQSLPDDPDNEPIADPNHDGSAELPSKPAPPPALTPGEEDQILAGYDYVDPQNLIREKPLKEALLYYHFRKAELGNSKVLSIIDFTQSSKQKRWYFINMETGAVWNIHVAHGKGSDKTHDGFAESFSNVSGSNASSLGFYQTAETYIGKHDYSLRLDGLSDTNSNARLRSIVVHGADYVVDKNQIQGRSWGCPAVSMKNRTKVIDLIKGGSLIYAVAN